MVCRKLNSLAKPDANLLARINKLLKVLETNKHTITINLWVDCWQITSEKDSMLATAFEMPDGECEFNQSPKIECVQCVLKIHCDL